MTNSEGTEEISVFARRERFCEDISGVICHGDVIKFDNTSIDLLTCIMVVCVDMFHPHIIGIASRKGNERLVIGEEGEGCKIMPEVFSKSDQPDPLCRCNGPCHKFGFH